MLLVLQSVILQIAQTWLEQEKKDDEAAKAAYMSEHCPVPDMSGDQAALMVRVTSENPLKEQKDPPNQREGAAPAQFMTS